MKSYDVQLEPLNATEIAFAGASSGFITRALAQPFDVLKIRFQLQVEPIKVTDHSKYTSMVQACRAIYLEEGITAFWKGHVPAQMLSISFGLVQFWLFESLVKQLKTADMSDYNKMLHNFTCGAIAGTTATVVSFPFDIMRTRLIAQSDDIKVYKTIKSGYHHLVKNEGVFALYKGLSPTILSVAPNAGFQFMFYKLFDKIYRKCLNLSETKYNFIGSMVSGSLAGFCSKMLVYPLDLTRKRMQIQGFQKYRRNFGANFVCMGLSNCLKEIYRKEGFLGYFKGMTPSLLKALVTSSLNFTAYESVCFLLLQLKYY